MSQPEAAPRTELQIALDMHNAQFNRANRMRDERDAALAEVQRLKAAVEVLAAVAAGEETR